MLAMDVVKAAATLGPIGLLLALGFAIALGSGVAGPDTGDRVRKLAGTLSRTILMFGVCLVGLAALQELVGFHLGLRG